MTHPAAAAMTASPAISVCLAFGVKAGGVDPALYTAETIVTGTGEAERKRGFKAGAEDVLIKVTGRPKLANTDRARSLIERAQELIASHDYEDRMKDIPIHDEQGTRDRPYFLRMTFEPSAFDAALASTGLKKWDGERPTVAIWLGIRDARSRYILSRNGESGYGQREVLKDASTRRSIPIILPEEGQKDVSYDDIVKRNWSTILNASQQMGANAVLYGTLEYDGRGYWNVAWVAAGDRAYAKWRLTGVTFDKALKGAIDRVMTAHARQTRHINRSSR